MSKDTAQMSPQFQRLVEDVAEWKKSRGELAYHVQEEVKSLLEQERQKVREEGKYWYFDRDDLVIIKGKWVVDRYKKHQPKKEQE